MKRREIERFLREMLDQMGLDGAADQFAERQLLKPIRLAIVLEAAVDVLLDTCPLEDSPSDDFVERGRVSTATDAVISISGTARLLRAMDRADPSPSSDPPGGEILQ